MSTISCRILSSPLLSAYELARATEYLASTRDMLLDALNGLSDSQWHFEPAPDCWSIAAILEHVVLTENRIHALLGQMGDAPPSDPDRVDSQIEEIILAKVPVRSVKLKASPLVSPSRRQSPEKILAHFRENRACTLELLVEAPFLRGHVIPHPVFGEWDGYQWILAAAAHGFRHTEQILEVKACSGFPETHTASDVSLH